VDGLIFFQTTVGLPATPLHFVTDCKEHFVVHPVNALYVAVDGVAFLTLWELQDFSSSFLESEGENKIIDNGGVGGYIIKV